MHISLCIYICIYVYVYICICVKKVSYRHQKVTHAGGKRPGERRWPGEGAHQAHQLHNLTQAIPKTNSSRARGPRKEAAIQKGSGATKVEFQVHQMRYRCLPYNAAQKRHGQIF